MLTWVMLNLRNIFVKPNVILIILFIWNHSSQGQIKLKYDTAHVDTVSFKIKRGFDVNDFIRMTKTDTSFFRAFKNLKMYPHISKNNVDIFDKEWNESAHLFRNANHFSTGDTGWINIVKEVTNGKVYKKNGKHKYFTAEMYDKVFFAEGKFAVNNNVGDSYSQESMNALSTKEKYYEKLKTFMFSPGTGVKGVPLIGKKLNIFDDKMLKYYDFKIEKTFFKDTVPCYKFSCVKRKDVQDKKVTITKLITFYDRRTMKIIARTYALKDNTAMFSFDIKMFIELKYEFEEYLPLKIKYNGEWNTPFKKGEKIKFEMNCSNYKDLIN